MARNAERRDARLTMTKKSRSIDREQYSVVLKGEHADKLQEAAWKQGILVEDMIEIAVASFINQQEDTE